MTESMHLELSVVACPPDQGDAVLDLIHDHGLVVQDRQEGDPHDNELGLGVPYVNEEAPLEVYDRFTYLLQCDAPGVSWELEAHPSDGGVGMIHRFTPDLGLWAADCDLDGEPVFRAKELLGDRKLGELEFKLGQTHEKELSDLREQNRNVVIASQRPEHPIDAMGFRHVIVDAALKEHTGQLDYATCAYVTDGGTYVIASDPKVNDDDVPHDLLGVLPMPLEGSRVVVLRPTVNPELVTALRSALDEDLIEDKDPENSITLEFEDTDTLRSALSHIGEADAPVMITRGRAVVDGQGYELWDDFDPAHN